MYDSTIAFKAHKQLRRFLGRISPHMKYVKLRNMAAPDEPSPQLEFALDWG